MTKSMTLLHLTDKLCFSSRLYFWSPKYVIFWICVIFFTMAVMFEMTTVLRWRINLNTFFLFMYGIMNICVEFSQKFWKKNGSGIQRSEWTGTRNTFYLAWSTITNQPTNQPNKQTTCKQTHFKSTWKALQSNKFKAINLKMHNKQSKQTK